MISEKSHRHVAPEHTHTLVFWYVGPALVLTVLSRNPKQYKLQNWGRDCAINWVIPGYEQIP
jgi:hypothetical protein